MIPKPILWAVGVILVYLLLQGIRSLLDGTIKYRDAAKNPKESGKGKGKKETEKKDGHKWPTWLLITGVIVLITSLIIYANQKKAEVARLEVAVVKAGDVQRSKQYIADLDPKPGMSLGNNYDAPLEAEITRKEIGKVLWFDVYFGEFDSIRIRLSWNAGMSCWEGYYEQDNPPDHGRVELQETAPEVWHGTLIDQNGNGGFYTLRRK